MDLKMMRKKRKTVKGMTLMECIIAILVVGIAGTIMAVTVNTTTRIMLNTNRMNNKLALEAPAANGQNAAVVTNTTANKPTTDPNNPVEVVAADPAQNVTFTVTLGSATDTIDAQKYDTRILALASDADCYTGTGDKWTAADRDANLWFYVINHTGP